MEKQIVVFLVYLSMGMMFFGMVMYFSKPKRKFCKNCKNYKGENHCQIKKTIISPIDGEKETIIRDYECENLNQNFNCSSYEVKR